MSKVSSFIHGIYPRSAELVQTSRDVDRKRLGIQDLKAQQKKDFDSFLQLEKTAKLEYLEDGKLTWQDIFRPIVEASGGMEVGALTRWYDNNCFFRQPIITGKIDFDAKKFKSSLQTVEGPWKVTLPSPFTFAKLSVNTGSDDFEKTLDQITKLLVSVVISLEESGVSLIQLNESYIPYHGAKKNELRLFQNSLAAIKKSLTKSQLAVHFYFGDASPAISFLSDHDSVDVIGIDFFRTPLTALPKKVPFAVIAGVVEARNSLLENSDTLQKFIEKAVKYLQPDTLYLSNNSDLDLLPEPVAREKVKLLGKISKEFK